MAALHTAVESGILGVVLILLEAGAEPNATMTGVNGPGSGLGTALHIAVSQWGMNRVGKCPGAWAGQYRALLADFLCWAAAPKWGDMEPEADSSGLFAIRKSKTNSEAEGSVSCLSREAVRSLEATSPEDSEPGIVVSGALGQVL